ncbi:MAG: penicillin-binding protein 2 [Candidatus Omnitrophota bacterium]|nr:penicillin-binding protein 2 [Candidatus Omnitrophota bacterium]
MASRPRAPSTNDRIVGALVVGLGVMGILWFRCAWLQVVGASRHASLAHVQHRLRQTLPACRGTIYDRHARPLAVSVPVPSVYANARHVAAKRDVALALGKLLGRDARMIERRLARDKGFVWVARQVDASMAPDLMRFRDAGIGLLEEPKRFYPHGSLASHLLGFVNIDAKGLEGLELAFNGVLQGEAGWRQTLRDARGEPLIGPWTTETAPVDGLDLVLTIDSVVQQVAEETLAWGVKKYHAKGGCILVLDPYTGAILAMANAPTFDANVPTESPIDARRNRAVTDVFEPGSIFKIVTASALLELGRVRPDEVFFCEEGSYRIPGRHTLHDHKPHGHLSFFDVIKYSSNIGTAKAAQRLSPDELYAMIRAFGFGQPTGIDAPGEVRGLLSPPARWSKTSPFIIPIGQEVAATPVQLAVMTAVIANGGLRVRPHLVDRVQAPDGHVVRRLSAREAVRVISPETARLVQDILRSVIVSGTGQLANVQGLTVAGKTGTAQKIEPTGRYSHSRFVASFVGFGPVPDSRFVMVVNVDEPRPLYFGGVVAAPVFKRVVEQLASYWALERRPPVMARLP